MNPQFDQSPGLHLPQPSANAAQPMQYAPQIMQSGNPQGGYSQQVPQPVQTPVPLPPATSSLPGASTSNDDDAVVDEEWVGKAREVAARYRSDPFAQSWELSRVKAQYLKARYNKDIKVSEDR